MITRISLRNVTQITVVKYGKVVITFRFVQSDHQNSNGGQNSQDSQNQNAHQNDNQTTPTFAHNVNNIFYKQPALIWLRLKMVVVKSAYTF